MSHWLEMDATAFDADAAPVQAQLDGMPARAARPGKRAPRGAELAGQVDIFAELADQDHEGTT